MSNRFLTLCLLARAHTQWLWLCVPVLACAALLAATHPATAGYLEAKLSGNKSVELAKQGFSVAISADGNTVLAGAPYDNSGVGAVWIFTRSGMRWTQTKLTATGMSGAAQLGWSVALSADGNTAVAGGPGDDSSAGAAWVFARNGNNWYQQMKLFAIDAVGRAEQGFSVALSGDGQTILVGGWADSNALGAAWVYTRNGNTWNYQSKLFSKDYAGDGTNSNVMQGFSVALDHAGATAIIGGPGDNGSVGAAWVFVRGTHGWSQPGPKLTTEPGLCNAPMQGFSVALGTEGRLALVGGPNDQTTDKNKADDSDCAISVQSTTQTGAAWLWSLNDGVGRPTDGIKLDVPLVNGEPIVGNPGLGYSVALGGEGHIALVGGPTHNADTGGAWMYTHTRGSPWTAASMLLGNGAVGAAGQASSLALSRDGTTAIIGGPLDNNQTGAAWVFMTQAPTSW